MAYRPSVMPLQRSVGPGQANLSSDVLQVQRLLNARARASVVDESGRFDANTAAALSRFQERQLHLFPPSGRVEPGSATWAELGGDAGPLDEAILAFEANAMAFAERFIKDARVRGNYVGEAQRFSEELRDQVARGALSVEQAAQQAVAMRNGLLDAARLQNSDIGRAVSEAEKAAGKSFADLVDHYATKLFGRGFKQLTPAQQDQVYAELVRAAGRPNPRFTSLARNLGRVGRGLLIVSLAYATYTVATSDRPGREAVRQGVGIGAGIGGSILGGAGAGLACGPGAPVCMGVGALIGGIAFAVGVDLTFEWLWE
jgi:hypothetical protein